MERYTDFGRVCLEGWAISGDEYKAHGLSGELVEPDWPALTLGEADRVLRRFPDAGGAEALLSVSPRPFSAASVVATKAGKVFLKRHALAVRDPEGLAEEHEFMAWLAGRTRLAGLVQAPLTADDGATAVVEGGWCYEAHPVAAGVDAYEDALSWTPFFHVSHAEAAGRAMAELHNAAEGYAAPARRRRQLVTSFTILPAANPYKAIEAYVAARPGLQAWLGARGWRAAVEEALGEFLEVLAGTVFSRYSAGQGTHPLAREFAPLWTHNDLHASNMTWTEEGVAAVIDFGLADRSCAVHDLATAIERNIVEWLRIGEPEETRGALVHIDQLDAMLAGYEALRPLSGEALEALAAILPLVHCEFALAEADYFLTVLGSEEKTALAWDGYFLGHARWFRTAEGRGLLKHLRGLAEGRGR